MNIVLWVVQVLIGLLFIMSGVMKFMMPYSEMIKDAPYAFPHAFLLFIGVCEILGGVGLIVPWLTGIKPWLTPLAASLLTIIMIGAVVFSAMTPIPAMAIVPAVVGLLCVFIARGRRAKA